jgi:hypothetical protein
MALMQIDGRWFRKLSEDFLIMRRMISAYRMAVLRQALQRLTSSANNTSSLQLAARKEKEILSKIWRTYRQETRGRLAIPAQG